MTEIQREVIKNMITAAEEPLLFNQFVSNWALCKWSIENWCEIFTNREIPFRCFQKNFVSDEPCWERKCTLKIKTFDDFAKDINNQEWMYFDYKYLHQWFDGNSKLTKQINWGQFGFNDKSAADSTLWAGSSGAHTPAHQDTYGINIVAQLYGKKRWIFFPPDTADLKPSRVPYEESSIYSELNFYSPSNLDCFKGLTGCKIVELCAGDALVVPRGWWHFVQNLEPVNIAVNVWLPHEKDPSALVSEALTKIIIAQVCKDLPQETSRLIVNPNEDDITEMPLDVLVMQLDTVVKSLSDIRRKTHRAKRQKTTDAEDHEPALKYNLKTIISDKTNKIFTLPDITDDELINLIKKNKEQFITTEINTNDDEKDVNTKNFDLTKALINAFTERNVIDLVKSNLMSKLS